MGMSHNVNMVLDAGNSMLKAGIFAGRELKEVCSLPYDQLQPLSEIVDKWQPVAVLLIASSGLEDRLDALLSGFASLRNRYRLSDFPKPFITEYKTPETLGEDRIAGLTGALALHPGEDVLLVQIGTCITYDLFVGGRHLGGAISPGANMRFRSMNDYTAKLPLVALEKENVAFPGMSTSDSLQVGVVSGIVAEIDSFISGSRQFSKKINVILTGGDAEQFAPRLKNTIFATPNLTLIGLNEILHLRK